jgi:hypothetical protein
LTGNGLDLSESCQFAETPERNAASSRITNWIAAAAVFVWEARGQIRRRKAAIRPEAQWLWALNGVPEAGLAATRDEAMAALKERWAKWLASAEVSATD